MDGKLSISSAIVEDEVFYKDEMMTPGVVYVVPPIATIDAKEDESLQELFTRVVKINPKTGSEFIVYQKKGVEQSELIYIKQSDEFTANEIKDNTDARSEFGYSFGFAISTTCKLLKKFGFNKTVLEILALSDEPRHVDNKDSKECAEYTELELIDYISNQLKFGWIDISGNGGDRFENAAVELLTRIIKNYETNLKRQMEE